MCVKRVDHTEIKMWIPKLLICFLSFFLNSLLVPDNFQHKNFFRHSAIFIIIVITTTSDHKELSVTRTKDYI